MQFSTLLTTASILVSLTQASTVKLFAENAAESSVNNKGLVGIHQGALIENVYLGDEATALTIEGTGIFTTYTYNNDQTGRLYLSAHLSGDLNNLAFIQGGEPIEWTIEDGHLKGNGSGNFWAAKNIGDTTGYSDSHFAVGWYAEDAYPKQVGDKVEIKVRAEITDSSSWGD